MGKALKFVALDKGIKKKAKKILAFFAKINEF